MMYIREHRSCYDRWPQVGNRGWFFDEVLAYCKKFVHNELFTDAWHGQHGLLWVRNLRTDNPIHQKYLEAARQAGYLVTDDFKGGQQEGLGIYQVTQQNGARRA